MDGKMTVKEKPIIAITAGDAAGIGPEIVVKALVPKEVYSLYRPLAVGEDVIVRETIELVGRSLELHPVNATAPTCDWV
jgi:4-hydroxy-L-threonine phosphate dehydrogenase PdxA